METEVALHARALAGVLERAGEAVGARGASDSRSNSSSSALIALHFALKRLDVPERAADADSSLWVHEAAC